MTNSDDTWNTEINFFTTDQFYTSKLTQMTSHEPHFHYTLKIILIFKINYIKVMPSYKTIAFQREENLFFKPQLNKEFSHISTEFNFSSEVCIFSHQTWNPWMHPLSSPIAIMYQPFWKHFLSRLFIERFFLDQTLLFSRTN